jgi:hypothetical protein
VANIRTFEAPKLDINPSDRGSSSAAAAARVVGANYNEAADAMTRGGVAMARAATDALEVGMKAAQHHEINAGTAKFAELQDNITKAWNETAKTADPNDPTVATKFREEVAQPALDKFRESFITEGARQWADGETSRLNQHIYTKTAADMSSLAGIAAKQNYTTTVNRLSSTVRNDPSSLDFALKTVETSIDAVASSSPNLTATAAASLRKDLTLSAKSEVVKSFLMGVAEKNPAQAQKLVESGEYAEFISGSEAKTIIGYAKAQTRLNTSEERAARVMQKEEQKAAFNKAVNDLELSTIPEDGTGRPTLPADYWQRVKQIGMMPGAAQDPGRIKTMVDNGDKIVARLTKPEPIAAVSSRTAMDLVERMRLPEGDPNRIDSTDDIYAAYGRGELKSSDFNFVQKEFREMRDPAGQTATRAKTEFLKSVKPLIDKSNPLMGKIDQSGAQQFYLFNQELNQRIDAQRKAGKPIYDLFNPAKPEYMGSPAALMEFQKPLQQSIRDISTRLRAPSVNLTAPGTTITGVEVTNAPVERRKPNESPADYLKRLGHK